LSHKVYCVGKNPELKKQAGPTGWPNNPAPVFLSIKGYPERHPQVLVVNKLFKKNGIYERFLGLFME